MKTHCSMAFQVLSMGRFMCHVPGIRWCRDLGTAPASCLGPVIFYIFDTLELSGPLLGNKEIASPADNKIYEAKNASVNTF